MTPLPPILPLRRVNEIMRALGQAFARPKPRIGFVPIQIDTDYYPSDLADALPRVEGVNAELVASFDADVVMVACHGFDMSGDLWKRRYGGFGGIIATWHIDNHVQPAANVSSALAADVLLPAHSQFSDSLGNPISILGPHLPLCASQWSRGQADRLASTALDVPRSDRPFANFVAYELSPRTQFLRQVAAAMPEAGIRLIPATERRQITGKSKDDRFREWASYKTSILLPVNRDLGFRVFDALLAGETVVADENIPDLDRVIPPADQRRLGIVRFSTRDLESLRRALAEARRIFDGRGMDGVRERHRFVRQGHMIEDRIVAAIGHLRALAEGRLRVRFDQLQDGRMALVATPASPR